MKIDYDARNDLEQRTELGYDLVAACHHNDVDLPAYPKRIALELTGENDGAEWHWIVELQDGTWAYVHGGCDYTGWDCQSSAEAFPAATLDGALALVDEAHRAMFVEMHAAGETARNNPSSW